MPLARGALLQELGDGIAFVDPAGRLADYNAAARGLLGLRDEDLGRPMAAARLNPAWFSAYNDPGGAR